MFSFRVPFDGFFFLLLWIGTWKSAHMGKEVCECIISDLMIDQDETFAIDLDFTM